MTAPLIALEAITKSFGATRALDHVSFAIGRGSVHAIVGENGAGKSTLMKILMGIHAPDSGRIVLDGQPVTLPSPQAARGLGIDIVFQEVVLCPNLSILENLFLGREKVSKGTMQFPQMRRRTQEVLQTVGLHSSPDRLVGGLSVAQKQMVQIGRAILNEPRVLILDEPTSALTRDGVDALFVILRRLHDQDVTILYISHKLEEVFAIADRVTVLRDGQHVWTGPVKEVSPDRLVELMVGRELDLSHRVEGKPGEVLLEVSDLWGEGFERISFTVRAGEVVGLAGLVGAGRTELVETLFGVRPPKQGEIRFQGRPIQGMNIPGRIKAGLGLVPEDRQFSGLVFALPLRENVSLPEVATRRLGRLRIHRQREHKAARDAIKTMRIVASGVEAEILSLSGGNQQKAVIGKWLGPRPKLLILDDPTRGIDVGAKAEIHQFIRAIAAEGRGVLMVSSELPELLALCDRILVMREGILTGEMAGESATEEAIMRLAVGTKRG